MLKRYLLFIQKYRWLVVLFSMILSYVSIILAARMTIKADLLELLPSSFDTVKSLKRISHKSGGIGYLIILAQSEDRENNIAFLKEFTEATENDPDVLYVDFKVPSEFIEKNGVLWLPLQDLNTIRDDLRARISYFRKKFLSLLPEELGPPPPFQTEQMMIDLEKQVSKSPYHENSDGTTVLAILKPKVDSTDIDFTRQFTDRIKSISAPIETRYPGVKVSYTGLYELKVANVESLSKDLLKATIFTIVGVSLSLLVFYRSAKGLLIVTLPLLFAVVWTLGLNSLIVGHVNLISSFFISVLMGIGIDYCIQIYSRFKEEYLNSKDYVEAMVVSFRTTGVGTLYGALTTLFVFVVLILSDFLAFKETGILASIGIILVFLCILIVLPALTFILKPRFSWFKEHQDLHEDSSASVQLMNFVDKNKRRIVMVVLAVSVLGIFAIPFNKFEYDFTALEDNSLPAKQAWNFLAEEFEANLRPSIIMVDSIENLSKLEKIIDEEFTPGEDEFAYYASILNYFPYPESDLEYRIQTVGEIRNLLMKNYSHLKESDRELVSKYLKYLKPERTLLENYPESIRNAFVADGPEGTHYFCLMYPEANAGLGLSAMRFARKLLNVKEKADFPVDVTSDSILLEEILHLVVSEGRVILPSAFIVIMILIMSLFRSFKKTLIILSPLVVGLYLLMVIMGLSNLLLTKGISMNYLNVVIIPILLGVGVDYAIHIYHRLEHAFAQHHLSKKERWHQIVQTAYALGISALTTIIGFSSLFLANYVGLRSIAWVSVVGIMTILVISVIFLPAVFFLLNEKKGKVGRGAHRSVKGKGEQG